MRPVTELYGRHDGEDIYVVGTGTSMRVFPLGFLDGKVTIGLNLAWRLTPVTYGITIGPHLHVPEFMAGEEPRPDITWITKRVKAKAVLDPEQFALADRDFFGFEADGQPNTQPFDEPSDAGRILDWVRLPTGANLYQWSSISQTAANLAANLGARNVILVGCDNCAILENHHSEQHHTKWLGADPEVRYRQYYEGLVEVRAALRQRRVELLSLSPFLKLDDPELDFRGLCDELDRPERVVPGPDISGVDSASRFAVAEPRPRADSARARLSRLRRAVRR